MSRWHELPANLDLQCGGPALRNGKNIYIVAVLMVLIVARLRIILSYDTVFLFKSPTVSILDRI